MFRLAGQEQKVLDGGDEEEIRRKLSQKDVEIARLQGLVKELRGSNAPPQEFSRPQADGAEQQRLQDLESNLQDWEQNCHAAEHRLKMLQRAFAADSTKVEHSFPTSVNSTAREDIRQICKHLCLNFRCRGEGTQKRILALKLDAMRERKRAEELALSAPRAAAGFYRDALNLFPEGDRIRVNGLFVQFYGGERAWSLGEAYSPEALAAAAAGFMPGEEEAAPWKKQRVGEAVAGPSDSDSEDIEALLGRWVPVPKDGERAAA
ncbi:unnamed protein product [Polarella glacialis]|uniref:Uncharacterized protein n=1 Tax=Polarella glacialis TaxID=89957 RepID=A0A813GXV1_POLGL|nr:unnamed protein product [Polarella glacialis]